MTHTFVGTTSKTIDLDPSEFAGMTVPQVTAEIMKTLRDIASDVNFWDADIEAAAIEIVESYRVEAVTGRYTVATKSDASPE